VKRLSALVGIIALSLPALAFAAFNDVTLTTDALISVGGYTLNVSGSSATIQSIVVNTSSFSVTLASGSSLTVSSRTLQQLSSDITSDIASIVCTGSASSIALAYAGGGTVTNVITPSATVCTGSGGASPPVSSGQGGGGLIVGSGPLAPGYVNTNPTGTSTVTAHGSTSHGGIPLLKNYQLWDAPKIFEPYKNSSTHMVLQLLKMVPAHRTMKRPSSASTPTARLSNFKKAKGYRKPATSGHLRVRY
jgi:hypothetical protein